MKETNKVYKIFLYAFFSFALLCSNNAKAQQKEEKIFRKINTYFGQLKKDGIQVCINNESELFKVIKQRKNKEMYNIVMESAGGNQPCMVSLSLCIQQSIKIYRS